MSGIGKEVGVLRFLLHCHLLVAWVSMAHIVEPIVSHYEVAVLTTSTEFTFLFHSSVKVHDIRRGLEQSCLQMTTAEWDNIPAKGVRRKQGEVS